MTEAPPGLLLLAPKVSAAVLQCYTRGRRRAAIPLAGRKTMAYEVVNGNSTTQDWRAIFMSRAQPSPERAWSWCPGSFTCGVKPQGFCVHCKQQVGFTWRGRSRGELPDHLTRPIASGVYIINVGLTDYVPDHQCFKIGCAKSVISRLRQHSRDRNHQQCVVLHCLPCPPGWYFCTAIEHLLRDQLEARVVKSKALKRREEYYEWNEGHVAFCERFLSPKLVEAIAGAVTRE